VTAEQVWSLFAAAYLTAPDGPGVEVVSFGSPGLSGVSRASESSGSGPAVITLVLAVNGAEYASEHHGSDLVAALTAALAGHDIMIDVLSVSQTSVKSERGRTVLALVEYRDADGTHWAARQDQTAATATVSAVVNAARRQAGSPAMS
jgi:2-isopropylmalate synthase